MDEQPSKFVRARTTGTDSHMSSLHEENDRLKAHIIALEEKISKLEEAAIHILKSCGNKKT